MISWRNAAIVLAVVCCIQRWQRCTTTSSSPSKVVEHVTESQPSVPRAIVNSIIPETTATAKPATRTWFGIKPPAWVARLLPQPGEKMRDYRDRVVPIAQLFVAPQRARVARIRDQFAEPQRTALDAATSKAATEIEARITTAVLNGELQTLRPMTGVGMARELLDVVDKGNTEFLASLTPDQRTQLATQHFDFAEYLLFATHWEDAL